MVDHDLSNLVSTARQFVRDAAADPHAAERMVAAMRNFTLEHLTQV